MARLASAAISARSTAAVDRRSSHNAIGSAVNALRSRGGEDGATDLTEVIAAQPPEALPLLRSLAAEREGIPFNPTDRFADVLRAAIVGIGTQRGETQADVLAALES